MKQANSEDQTMEKTPSNATEPAKWDYTSNRQNFITGAMVVGGNLLILILYVLYRTVPAVHTFISGKPL